MNFRTDLALERRENLNESEIDGVICQTQTDENVTVSTITIENEHGSKVLGKPKGTYITLEVKPFMSSAELLDSQLTTLAEKLKSLLPKTGTVLVAGLGNEKITPDALGPRCISLLLATRHISDELAKSIGFTSLRSVAGIVPGVLGQTGIETVEIIEGVVKKIKPSAVIIVDALASRKLSRLGTTVQMTNTGVSPGSGVGNSRKNIDEKTLGVPVVAIGVPTVVDGATMAFDLLEKLDITQDHEMYVEKMGDEKFMMVTPKEIDLVIDRAAKLVAMGINLALQPSLSVEEILGIVS
ncbi:MAG: GPR endopeptidase [Clostridia bacterium]